MTASNQTIRLRAKEAGVKLWQIADRMGIEDTIPPPVPARQ